MLAARYFWNMELKQSAVIDLHQLPQRFFEAKPPIQTNFSSGELPAFAKGTDPL
jgi:hypothetical protein